MVFLNLGLSLLVGYSLIPSGISRKKCERVRGVFVREMLLVFYYLLIFY